MINWALVAAAVLGSLLSVPLATLTVRRLPETLTRAGRHFDDPAGLATCWLERCQLLTSGVDLQSFRWKIPWRDVL